MGIDLDFFAGSSHFYLGTFVVGLLSGLVPVINIEVYLVAVGSLSGASPVPVVLLTTLGQMLGKCILYLSGQGFVKLSLWPSWKSLERTREAFDRHKSRTEGLVFISALTGIPPFYALSVMAGVMRIPILRFLVPGTLGRCLRFSVVLWASRFLKTAF
jgi:membrane protein YqaA with SNARE-associated domain